ncbi:hypothetical protein C5688_06485 [Methylocystis sp. MitZ-2018]|nr:hypothetical protein C5688_06485 [Methylocystis sp. MitZ-2018]
MQKALAETFRSAPEGSEVFLELLHQGSMAFERFHNLAKFEDTNDVHVTAAVSCMGIGRLMG